MGQILVRNLEDAVIAALKRLAAASGTSTEEQARRALTSAVGLDRAAAARRLAEIRNRIGKVPGPSSVELLRQDRDRDG
jgi:plasmid stability protein